MNPDLSKIPITELEKAINASQDGLSQAEAQKRLTQFSIGIDDLHGGVSV